MPAAGMAGDWISEFCYYFLSGDLGPPLLQISSLDRYGPFRFESSKLRKVRELDLGELLGYPRKTLLPSLRYPV